jgi:UDP-N-acetylglucosamine--N-acetylmuramyl-(pentapeptide) pyrophosphoryl-undecaprenol N-acetylglucosamine transferase
MCCAAAIALRAQGVEFEIVHQTGEADLDATIARYQEGDVPADCRAFIADMASEYKAADLIVSRAGATTIAELGIVGVPAVLIPYPFAANNHQELNAQEMVDAGAALMLRQEGNADGSALAALLAQLASDAHKRAAMATAMREFGRADAATKVVAWATS